VNTLHLILRAVGTCILILAGSIVANWVVWMLVLGLMLPFTVWRVVKRRNRG
jgi:hypothetical protein